MVKHMSSEETLLLANAQKLGFGSITSLLGNVDLIPSNNLKLNKYILSIENLGTLRKENASLVLQKKVYEDVNKKNIGFHNKIIWAETPVNFKEFFKTTSNYVINFYGELYSLDIPPIQRDTLDQGFFNFINENKNFNNEDSNPLIDYARFSFPIEWNVHNTNILSGFKSIPKSGARIFSVGINRVPFLNSTNLLQNSSSFYNFGPSGVGVRVVGGSTNMPTGGLRNPNIQNGYWEAWSSSSGVFVWLGPQSGYELWSGLYTSSTNITGQKLGTQVNQYNNSINFYQINPAQNNIARVDNKEPIYITVDYTSNWGGYQAVWEASANGINWTGFNLSKLKIVKDNPNTDWYYRTIGSTNQVSGLPQNPGFNTYQINPTDYYSGRLPSGASYLRIRDYAGVNGGGNLNFYVEYTPLSGTNHTYFFTDYVLTNNVYNFNSLTGLIHRSFVSGNLNTINSIKNKNTFIYNSNYSGYVIYPQSIYLHRLPKYNIDTIIVPNSLHGDANLNGILLVSTGNHYGQNIVYISPHTGIAKDFNTVVETFETLPQSFATQPTRCKKYINPSDPRSCSWTGFTGVPNYIKTSYGISVPGIDVSSIYINTGYIFPIGLIHKTDAELDNIASNTGITATWPISGLITPEMIEYFQVFSGVSGLEESSNDIIPNINGPTLSGFSQFEELNLFYFMNMAQNCDLYKVSGFLKQTTPIKDTIFYKLYSGLYTGNKLFNTGVWDGIVPSGTNIFFEFVSTNEQPCGTEIDFLLLHKNYGDNSLEDVAIKTTMGLSKSFDTSITKNFTSTSFNSVEDGFWKNFQKLENFKRTIYIKNLKYNYPSLIIETKRAERSQKFFLEKRKTTFMKYNKFKYSNFAVAASS